MGKEEMFSEKTEFGHPTFDLRGYPRGWNPGALGFGPSTFDLRLWTFDLSLIWKPMPLKALLIGWVGSSILTVTVSFHGCPLKIPRTQ